MLLNFFFYRNPKCSKIADMGKGRYVLERPIRPAFTPIADLNEVYRIRNTEISIRRIRLRSLGVTGKNNYSLQVFRCLKGIKSQKDHPILQVRRTNCIKPSVSSKWRMTG